MGKAPITTATITIPETNTDEQDQKKIKTKTKTKTKNREEAFPRLSEQRRSWAGQATQPPKPRGPSSDQQTANQSPPPSHAWLLAACLLHRCDILAQ
ncbi:hypothetical protein THAR02_02266 [Trichoderma harzianum]|uniref:Uncharacterized protein n=1 Tax=Trichoderma harzianum TaxID=5544 RepID=A0A0F9XMA3_TRIHA|nr:hypothetical protein THAR02_02266 [Trichoderma harzianum]